MPLEKRVAEYMLNGGLDTREHAEAEDPSSLRDATGVRYGDLGRFDRFPGAYSTTTPAAPSNGQWGGVQAANSLIRHRDAPVAIEPNYGLCRMIPSSSGSFGSYAWTNPAANIPPQCAAPQAQVSRRMLGAVQQSVDSAGSLGNIACAVYGDYIAVCWVEMRTATTARVHFRAYSLTSLDEVTEQQNYFVNVTGNPYVAVGACTVGTTIVCTYTANAAAPYQVIAVTFTPSTRLWSTYGAITTNAQTLLHTVVQNRSTPTRFYFGFVDNTSGFLTVQDRTLAAVTTTHTATHGAASGCAVVADGASTLIVSADGLNTVKAEIFGTPATVVTVYTMGANEIATGIAAAYQVQSTYTDAAAVFVEILDTNVSSRSMVAVQHLRYYTTFATVGSSYDIDNCYLASSGFTVDGRAYVAIHDTSEYQSSLGSIIVGRSDVGSSGGGKFIPCARVSHDRALNMGLSLFSGTTSVVVDGDTAYFATMGDRTEDTIPLGAGTSYMSTTAFLHTIKMHNDALPVPFVEHQGCTYFASGMLYCYDGKHVTEAQPTRRPRCYYGGAAGTVSVVALYRWTDAAGNLHRSAPSTPVLITAGGTVYVEQPAVFSLDGVYVPEVEVVLYATAAGGSTYYLANTAAGAKDFYDSVAAGGQFWTFTAVQAGSSANPPLYSTGAGSEPLVSEPPPALHHIAIIGDRMWGVDAEDRTRIWFSKPFVAGYAPEWNAACTLVVGDDAEAVEEVGGVPTVFCRKSIWQIYGEGPNALGAGAFAPARRIPVERGCTNRSSVCRTPQGVVFLSGDVICMLDNGGQLQLIGLPIARMTGIVFSCGRIVYDATHDEVRVYSTGVVGWMYVYSMLNQRWTRRAKDDDEISPLDGVAVGRRVWSIHKPAISGSPAVVEEGIHYDMEPSLSAADDVTIETPWIKLDGLAGYGRVWRLIVPVMFNGGTAAGTTFTISVAYDYDTSGTYSDVFTFTSADFSTWTSYKVRDLILKPRIQKCSSIKIKLEQGGGGAYLVNPLSVRIEYGVRPGTRQAATRGGAGTPS